MAQNGQFGLAMGVLTVLAAEPEQWHTSVEIAEALGTGPVMVRRMFGVLHRAGLIVQRKGPSGGARLKHSAKSIGLGEVFLATEPGWLQTADATLDVVTQRVRRAAIAAMNETTLAGVMKKRKNL